VGAASLGEPAGIEIDVGLAGANRFRDQAPESVKRDKKSRDGRNPGRWLKSDRKAAAREYTIIMERQKEIDT